MSVHAPDLSDCGANAGSGYIRGVAVLLGAAHVPLDTGEVADQHYCFCYLPVLLSSAAVGLETVVGFDPSGVAVTVVVSAEVGSSLLLHHRHHRHLLLLLLPEAAAVSWNESRFHLVSL